MWSEPLPIRVSTRFVSVTSAVSFSIFGSLSSFLLLLAKARLLPCFVERLTRRWILKRVAGLNQHRRERSHGAAIQIWSRGGRVHIDVSDSLFAQLIGELLTPFGRAGESDFLSVPTADDHGPPRTNALLQKLAERASQLHHRGRATAGIDTAEDPGVAVVSDHDPLVREFRAANSRFHDVIRFDRVIHFCLEMYTSLFAAQVILIGRPPCQSVGRDRAAHVLQAAAWHHARKAAAP